MKKEQFIKALDILKEKAIINYQWKKPNLLYVDDGGTDREVEAYYTFDKEDNLLEINYEELSKEYEKVENTITKLQKQLKDIEEKLEIMSE